MKAFVGRRESIYFFLNFYICCCCCCFFLFFCSAHCRSHTPTMLKMKEKKTQALLVVLPLGVGSATTMVGWPVVAFCAILERVL